MSARLRDIAPQAQEIAAAGARPASDVRTVTIAAAVGGTHVGPIG